MIYVLEPERSEELAARAAAAAQEVEGVDLVLMMRGREASA